MKTLTGRLASLWTYGEAVFLSQDVSLEGVQRFCVPELGIDADYMSAYSMAARMVWRFTPEMIRLEDSYKAKLRLPPVYSGVQIRGGDKITETSLIDGKTIISRLEFGSEEACLFILTDDYLQYRKAQEDFPNLRILTLCQQDEKGYCHQRFCNEDPFQQEGCHPPPSRLRRPAAIKPFLCGKHHHRAECLHHEGEAPRPARSGRGLPKGGTDNGIAPLHQRTLLNIHTIPQQTCYQVILIPNGHVNITGCSVHTVRVCPPEGMNLLNVGSANMLVCGANLY